jgi:hypothetical protein
MFENKPRSLTLPEIRSVRLIDDPNEADIEMLSLAYGHGQAAVEAWFRGVPAGQALRVLQAAWDASNATEDATFPDPQANDAVAGWRDE